jgi:hypothetical protein
MLRGLRLSANKEKVDAQMTEQKVTIRALWAAHTPWDWWPLPQEDKHGG